MNKGVKFDYSTGHTDSFSWMESEIAARKSGLMIENEMTGCLEYEDGQKIVDRGITFELFDEIF